MIVKTKPMTVIAGSMFHLLIHIPGEVGHFGIRPSLFGHAKWSCRLYDTIWTILYYMENKTCVKLDSVVLYGP